MDADRIRKRVAELDRRIDNGAERIFSAPSSLTSTLYKKLEQLRAEGDRVHVQLEDAKRRLDGADQQGSEAVENAISALRNLSGAFENADPLDARGLLASLVSRIDLFFNRHKCRKYTRTSFREGLIHVRPDPAFTSLSTTSLQSDSLCMHACRPDTGGLFRPKQIVCLEEFFAPLHHLVVEFKVEEEVAVAAVGMGHEFA